MSPAKRRRRKAVQGDERRPTLLTALIQWQNGGRYEKDETTHGHLLKLFSDATVRSQMVFEDKTGKRSYSEGRLAMTLLPMKQESEDLETFADRWAKMYDGRGYIRQNAAQIKIMLHEETKK